jgi:hypothetical protein
MIGVDYDLFWTLNPKSLSPFVKAFSLKQKYDDAIAWSQGIYIRMAIGSCLSKNTKYPEKPMMADKVKIEPPKPMTMEEIKRRFMAHANDINVKFGKEVNNG